MFNYSCEAELLPRLRDLGWKADPATSCSTGKLCEAVEVMVDLHRALKDTSGAGLQNYTGPRSPSIPTKVIEGRPVSGSYEGSHKNHRISFGAVDKESKI